MRRRPATFAVALAVVLACFPHPAGATPANQPTATAELAHASLGQLVRLQGSNWTDVGDVVSVQVCGNQALDLSADCDVANTAEGAIRADGTFFTGISLTRPPTPCPCVLRVASGTSSATVLVPIDILGLPVQAPSQKFVPQRLVRLSKVKVQGNGPLASWFGAHPTRTLVFEVQNTGDVLLHNPAIDITWGRGRDPSGYVAPPSLGDLAPNQTEDVSVQIPMSAFSLGNYTVKVSIDPIGAIATARVHTSSYPWGLFLAALILVQLTLLAFRNRARRRLLGLDDVQIDTIEGAAA